MGRDTKQRVRVRTNQVWSTDKASAAAPSSEDVVLAWLTTPGNMERWRGGRTSKLDLSEEIVRGLEANGIVTRSAVGVYEKIRYLEGGFITATADLIVKKKLNEFLRGEASAEVEKEIGWSASLYRELVPVFGKEVTGKKLPMVTVPERAPVTRAREVMASAAAVRAALGSANNKNKSPGTKNQKNAAGKWKENLEKSRAQEARPVEVKKEGVAAANGGGNEKERAPAAKEAEAGAGVGGSGDGGVQVQKKKAEENDVDMEEKRSSVAEKNKDGDVEEKPRNDSDEEKKSESDEDGDDDKEEQIPLAQPDKVEEVEEEENEEEDEQSEESEEEAGADDEDREKQKEGDEEEDDEDAEEEDEEEEEETEEIPEQGNAEAKVSSADAASSSSDSESEEDNEAEDAATDAKGDSDDEEVDAEMEDPDKEESDLDPAHTPRKRPTSDPSPAAKRYRRSSAVTRDLERETFIERAKQEQAQRQELFELERAKVECELQAKRVQLMMERSLARKTLLSAGVDPAEVDRVLPL
ncbi:hypothetical protein PF007_g13939 [Phytophthora fragariae]|uniref:Uncharacterized protein n=1 Tax=Phytophthora fragariae TaxID=53985 RepID=A0A6A3KCS0_9STRA|nr:hypothetical protein PF011_g12473 [Phytophthora fragariae]KAE9104766.1 hypothetical protein PF007_g13939 [Phytophthora fragariae]KAE9142195.1 hypothetical protein PF006_g12680 [Phytophthora fragariae]KAE9224069.1 hypothetical protein PF004_g12329 [Phytophthora fragariae]